MANPKGEGCVGCPLQHKGTGWAPPVGPKDAKLIFVGEALGEDEAATGRPFVGKAGAILSRICSRLGIDRDEVQITNVLWCRPPNNALAGEAYEEAAIKHCTEAHLVPLLVGAGGGAKADLSDRGTILSLGATPTKFLTAHSGPHKQQDWHGTVTRRNFGGNTFAIVPTFHPAFIARGNQDLIGASLFDFRVAEECSVGKYRNSTPRLIVDPSPSTFARYIEEAEGCNEVAVDIETRDKSGKPEDEVEDGFSGIDRINFSVSKDEGLTVPWTDDYIPLIKRLLEQPSTKIFWNAEFDVPRLKAAGCTINGEIHDGMWAWHVLRSALPRGLGFVAPFYSTAGPWKHLVDDEFGTYAAMDAVQTFRCWQGIKADLQTRKQWEVYLQHVKRMDDLVLRPAKEIGIAVSKERLEPFKKELEERKATIEASLTHVYPEELIRLHPKAGWKRRPIGDKFEIGFKRGQEKVTVSYTQADIVTNYVEEEQLACYNCGVGPTTAKHKCLEGKPALAMTPSFVPRFFVREPFNPNSDDQVRAYMAKKGFTSRPGKDAKTTKVSTGKKVLESFKDPFLNGILEFRAIEKIYSTYVVGAEKRLAVDGRLHPTFTHKPSTGRLSCVNPNLQNVAGDRKGSIAGFRRCIIPAPGHVLVEVDFSGIEAVQTGWFSRDAEYIRLSRLGVHAFITSHIVGQPISLRWADNDIAKAFAEIKGKFPEEYDRAKRVVHGTNYGLSVRGIVLNYPDKFTLRSASQIQRTYFDLCPRLGPWQREVRDYAHRNNYLGGANHPFGYRHDFWDVYTPSPAGQHPYGNGKVDFRFGPDAKRVVAYYPQSTSAGVLYEACLRLMDQENPNYIGDYYGGRSPIRALIHDSILFEVSKEKADSLIEKVVAEMTRPIVQQPMAKLGLPGYLSIGVEVKAGPSWGEMSKVVPELGVTSDLDEMGEEDEDALGLDKTQDLV